MDWWMFSRVACRRCTKWMKNISIHWKLTYFLSLFFNDVTRVVFWSFIVFVHAPKAIHMGMKEMKFAKKRDSKSRFFIDENWLCLISSWSTFPYLVPKTFRTWKDVTQGLKMTNEWISRKLSKPIMHVLTMHVMLIYWSHTF